MARVPERIGARAVVLGTAVAFLGALAGCRAALDATAQLTGTGRDPEGVVHAFLVARKNERDTKHGPTPRDAGVRRREGARPLTIRECSKPRRQAPRLW